MELIQVKVANNGVIWANPQHIIALHTYEIKFKADDKEQTKQKYALYMRGSGGTDGENSFDLDKEEYDKLVRLFTEQKMPPIEPSVVVPF
jgi:hypothetical protein